MSWSKEVAEALAVIERAYGSFVLVARSKQAGVLVHAHAPTRELIDDVERWLKAYRATPPAVSSGKYDAALDLTEPCPQCKERHRKDQYVPGKAVRVLVGRGKREEMGGTFDAVPEGARGVIQSWSAYGGPMRVRIELVACFWSPNSDDTMTRRRMVESYYPCELEVLP